MLVHQRSARLFTGHSLQTLSSWPTSELEELHQLGISHYRAETPWQPDGASWLQLKQLLARRHLQDCDFCVHDCRVNRTLAPGGYCQLGANSPYSGAYLHWGEEPQIRPTWAVFLGGCTMHCAYCHNWRDTFETRHQPVLTAHKWVQQLETQSQKEQYRTLSFIGGTPEPHLHTLLDCMQALSTRPELAAPLVLNNNATLSDFGLDLMEGVVDIYVPDYKHGNNSCAFQLTKIGKYTQTIRKNLRRYREQKAGILVRHLPVPGHLECCTYPVLKDLAKWLPGVMVNVMLEYQPMYKAAGMEGVNRVLSLEEKERVQRWVGELGLKGCW